MYRVPDAIASTVHRRERQVAVGPALVEALPQPVAFRRSSDCPDAARTYRQGSWEDDARCCTADDGRGSAASTSTLYGSRLHRPTFGQSHSGESENTAKPPAV